MARRQVGTATRHGWRWVQTDGGVRRCRPDRAVIANQQQVRLIAHAKIKTDRIDASVLARLYASGFLPEVWIPDESTQALRRQVTRRNQIVRQRTRLKNIIQSILHA